MLSLLPTEMTGEKDLEDDNNCQGQSSYTNMKGCNKSQNSLLAKQSLRMAAVVSTWEMNGARAASANTGIILRMQQPPRRKGRLGRY